MKQDLAVDIRGVSKSYKGLKTRVSALENIDLQVKQGEIFGFLGPNGAGKTTLIKIMMGMLKPDGGTVSVMGASPEGRDSRRRLGYLPERPYLHDFLTGDEFLRFHGRLFSMTEDEITARIPKVVGLVDMERGRKLELKKYSKGMLQRIGLAQALLHDPDVLVLDEPMSGLDPVGRKEVRDLITEIARLGKTVFFSTHIVHDVEIICSNVGFINRGRLRSSGNLEQALDRTLKSIEFKFFLPEHVVNKCPELKGAARAVDGWVLEARIGGTSPLAEVERRIDEAIRAVIRENGRVISVVPRKGDLEELFFEDMP